jgi:hypothetical protein
MAYLMKIGIIEAALMPIKKVRPFIKPNPTQVARLIELEAFYHFKK